MLMQKVIVRVTKNEQLTVKINFTFFALLLCEEKLNHKKIRQLSKIFLNFRGMFKSLKYLLPKTDILLHVNETEVSAAYETKPMIDISFHFSLFRMIISALILLYYIVKSKVKRVIKNA